MSTDDSRWWNDATADEASKCKSVTDEFLRAPTLAKKDEFARALALFIILGGDDAAIRERLDKISDTQLGPVCEGLRTFERKLSACGATISTNLQQTIAKLTKHDNENISKVAAERSRRINLHARTIKIPPKS